MAKAKLHTVFTSLLDSWVGQAERSALADQHLQQRAWSGPGLKWTKETGKPEEIAKAYSRTEINDNLLACYVEDPPATQADTAALSVQLGAVSAAERAFQLRHANGLRAEAHAAARQAGQGHPSGTLRQGLLAQVQELIDQGLQNEQS